MPIKGKLGLSALICANKRVTRIVSIKYFGKLIKEYIREK